LGCEEVAKFINRTSTDEIRDIIIERTALTLKK
jgi:hypothetical protein